MAQQNPLTNLDELKEISTQAWLAYQTGNISEEEYRDLKGRLYELTMSNMFAAISAYTYS